MLLRPRCNSSCFTQLAPAALLVSELATAIGSNVSGQQFFKSSAQLYIQRTVFGESSIGHDAGSIKIRGTYNRVADIRIGRTSLVKILDLNQALSFNCALSKTEGQNQ
jgi:hypothetical protein